MKESQKYNRLIFNSFDLWSVHTNSHNFPAMLALVQPNSNFHELTNTCQQSHETGINYFYEFDELEVVNFSNKNTEATIHGIVILIMVSADIKYKGKFISTCCKDNSSPDWKLKDIEIEWE